MGSGMHDGSMKTSALPLVLTGAVALLAIGNLIQYRTNQQLRQEVAALGGSGPSDSGGGTTGKAETTAGSTGGGSGSGGAGRSDTEGEKLAGMKIREKSSGEGERETFSSLAERYAKSVQDNPAIQKQMLAQFEAQLGDVLEGLYDHFELEGEELSHFKGRK